MCHIVIKNPLFIALFDDDTSVKRYDTSITRVMLIKKTAIDIRLQFDVRIGILGAVLGQ